MTPDARRQLGAIAALVIGVFIGLCLLPFVPTGWLGNTLGRLLWRTLGVGAVGLPLLGGMLALAGFDRLPRLDMKRTAILVGGLAVIVPFTVGVLAGVTPASFDPRLEEWTAAARASGMVPGIASYAVTGLIAKPGGLLLAFLAVSALTILTIAWHPLRRFEKGPAVAEPAPARAVVARRAPKSMLPAGDDEDDDEDEAPAARVPAAAVAAPKPAKLLASKAGKATRQAKGTPAPPPTGDENELPPVNLLTEPAQSDVIADQAQLDRLGQSLLETLRTFKVDGSIEGYTSGPVVTQFEIKPAPGVKAGRIIGLADDLAIAMRASSVRVAPIPGKGAVGVEVPNPKARMVSLREMLETPEWEKSKAILPIALGLDLEGKPVITDLAKMPHLLIAGATGTGKSVGINSIISCLIYRYTAKELRFLMVDPKMVELSMYNALPHLRHRVVTNNNDAARVLKWAVFEMNRRYELLSANDSRNIADFNRKLNEGKSLRNPTRPEPTLKELAAQEETTPPEAPLPEIYGEGPLPYIVIIVDELADLMMTVASEVETPLAMLAQKARAIGIHLILATQRPSVNVLTGLIKANFPSRIAFRVASKVDSRTILDQNGAESLLGNGDMLFLPPGRSEPMRLQGAFIGTEETETVMDWFTKRREKREADQLAERREENIIDLIRAQEAEESGGADGNDDADRDDLFREAAEACVQNQGGSTSLLQRKLRIGYGRAARIIDQLHAAGILGPSDGSKPREVLISLSQLDEYAG